MHWKVSLDVEAGVAKLEFDNYGNLPIGDILEIDPGTEMAEMVTITKFGSVYLSGPTRFPHRAGA